MSAVSKADVLETYADLYYVFEDNKAICKELDKIYDRLNTLPPAQPEVRTQMSSADCISRQAAIDIFDDYNVSVENGDLEAYSRDRKRLCELPSAQPDIAEKLYLCKCYVTDEEGLQHEVIHTGDIRRVTGWEI